MKAAMVLVLALFAPFVLALIVSALLWWKHR